MKISALDIPEEVRSLYIDSGIDELYPPQEKAIQAGLLDGRNLMAAVPTASGKTMMAELAMLKSIFNGGKCLYIVPLRALASEKFQRFREFESMGVKAGISSGDLDTKDDWLAGCDIIVATSEKTDSLIRNGATWLHEITVIVVDEIHLLDSPDRGPTLEVTIAQLVQMNPDAQIIALSATVGNAREMADWLDAALVECEWRPVDLREGVYLGNAINFVNSQRSVEARSSDDLLNLVADTLSEGGQCLVFESSRRNAEGSARRLGQKLAPMLHSSDLARLHDLSRQVQDTGDTQISKKLADCIKGGAAFHHAGLLSEQRRLIEDGFRANIIKVLSSTPTLAAGLNLPARRVIIRGFKRYDPNFGSVPIPILEYKQMAGRAGRPRMDPYGEAVLVSRSYDELNQLLEYYVLGPPEDIWSKLGTEQALRTHILSAVATGVARTREQLMDFLGHTFYAHQQDTWKLATVVDEVIAFLEQNEMLVDSDGLHPTRLGALVSKLYIDPLSASIVVNGLRMLDSVNTTEITLLHLICMTPDMRNLFLRSGDYSWLGDMAAQYSGQLVHPPSPHSSEYEWFLSEIKTALVLLDWISEVKEDEITRQFNIGPGDIRAQAETARWLMHSTARICAHLGLGYTQFIQDLTQRISYGAASELLPIIRIRGIGRARARKLYTAGYRDIDAIRTAGYEKLTKILGPKIAANTLKQLGIEVDAPDITSRPGDQNILDF